MSATDVDSLIPGQAKSDLDYMVKGTESLYGNILKVVDVSKGLRLGAFDDKSLLGAAAATEKQTKAQSELTLSLVEYKKMQDELAKSQARLNALESDSAKQLAAAKITQQERNKALTDEAKLQKAVNNSIDEARAKVKVLTTERNALNLKTAEGKTRQKELNDEIDRHNAFIKENVDQYQKQKINIGNYSGALKILEGELTTIRQKIDDETKAGQANTAMLERWQKEEALLTRLVEGQAAGFASATGELRNNEKALQAMSAAGLEGTEMFKQLLAETGKLKDNVGDLKQEIKNLASDTRMLDGAVGTAQLLASSYGIAAGAAQLFGDDNEELQKSMVKLQAITTILIGLQQIQNAVQKESSVTLFLNTVATKAAAAGQTLLAFATGGTTLALRAFRIALLATGIGAIVVLLTSATVAMEGMGDATDDSTDSFKKNNEELEKNKQLLEDVVSASEKVRNARTGGLDDLKRELALMKAKGATAKEIFDKEQQIAAEELRNLRIRQASGLDVTKEGKDKANEIEVNKAEFAKTQAEKAKEHQKKLTEDEKKRRDERKKAVDEEFKFQFETQKKALELEINNNKAIVDDDNSTYEDKILALTQYYKDKTQLLIATADFEKMQGNKSASEIKSIDEQLAIDLKALNEEALNSDIAINLKKLEEDKKTREEQKRNAEEVLQAEKEINDKRLELEKELQDKKRQLSEQGVDTLAKLLEMGVDHDMKALDKRVALMNQEKQFELAKIDALLISDQEKADRRVKIEEESLATQKEIEKEKAALEKRKFVIEQSSALAKIIFTTQAAAAEIQARAAVLLSTPATAGLAPLALAQLPYVYGSAAISAGLIAAQMLSYAEGTGEGGHPGGPAEVAEAGLPEFMRIPGKPWQLVKQHTIFPDMPKGTEVLPLHKLSDSMLAPYLVPMLLQQYGSNEAVISALYSTNNKLDKLIEKPVPVTTIARGAISHAVFNGNERLQRIKRNILD